MPTTTMRARWRSAWWAIPLPVSPAQGDRCAGALRHQRAGDGRDGRRQGRRRPRVASALAAPRGSLRHADCASLPRSLFESELFGHERGAFTGAVARRAGRFERARGGTIFLDEVERARAVAPAAMLCVPGAPRSSGGRRGAPVGMTARVVAATSRDLRAEVERGRFRLDLYFRLDVARLRLPRCASGSGICPGSPTPCSRASRPDAAAAAAPRGFCLARLRAAPLARNVRVSSRTRSSAWRCGCGATSPAPRTWPKPWRAGSRAAGCGPHRHGAARERRQPDARGARAGLPRTTLRRRLASAQAEQTGSSESTSCGAMPVSTTL